MESRSSELLAFMSGIAVTAATAAGVMWYTSSSGSSWLGSSAVRASDTRRHDMRPEHDGNVSMVAEGEDELKAEQTMDDTQADVTDLTQLDDGADPDVESRNLLQLLYSIASEQARKEGYVHRGITCNLCKQSPLRGIRYKCMNCVDYDVCENCEVIDRHNSAHVFVKIRVPIPPLANPREALHQPFYVGFKTKMENLTWAKFQKLQQDTHFDKVELEALYMQFHSLSTSTKDGGGIEKSTFDRCLGPLCGTNNLIAERFFRFFDKDGDGVINFTDLVSGLSVLCKGTQGEKIVYAFKGYDLHNKGYISRNELRDMFRAYFLLSMELVRDVVRALEQEMMANFNDEGDKPVSALFTAPIPDPVRPGRDGAKKDGAGGGAASSIPGQYRLTRSRSDEEFGSLMESMSDGAIEELITLAFESADLVHQDRMTFDEFKKWATTDATIIAWFDSLGSVF